MRKLFVGFLIVLIAIGIGFLVQKDTGYVLLAYGGYTLETSIWVAFASVVIFFFLLYFIIRVLKHTSLLGQRFQNWGDSRKNRKARSKTHQGLCELAEGRFDLAEKSLKKAASLSDDTLIHHLASATAAHKQNAYDRRDKYLTSAIKHNKDSELAVLLTQAQLQIEARQWERALATLHRILQIDSKHTYALKLVKRVYFNLKEWHKLLEILPVLKSKKVLSQEEITKLELIVYENLLSQQMDFNSLQKLWRRIPKQCQADKNCLYIYCNKLLAFNEHKAVIDIIQSQLKKNFDERFLLLYSKAQGDNAKQLLAAEKWLSKHPRDPALLLCLGRISMREKFWGKARDYLEKALEIQKSPEIYQALGQVFESIGDHEAALQHYKSMKA